MPCALLYTRGGGGAFTGCPGGVLGVQIADQQGACLCTGSLPVYREHRLGGAHEQELQRVSDYPTVLLSGLKWVICN